MSTPTMHQVGEVIERRASSLGVVVVGLVAGVLCAIAGPEPTGSTGTSAVLVVLAVAAVCWIGAAAPRRVLAWTVLIAGVMSLWIPAIVIGLVVFSVAYASERNARSDDDPMADSWHAPIVNAALAGVALNLAARSRVEGVLGLSFVVAVAIAGVILIAGLMKRGTVARRVVGFASLGLIIAAAAASLAFGAASMSVANELSDGEQLVRDGVAHLGDADIESALVSFQQANQRFSTAERRMSSPLVAAAAAVPVVAQQRDAALTVSSEASDVTAQVTDLLDGLGPEALSVVDAKIDLDGLVAFTDALAQIQVSLDGLDAEVTRVSSPWLFSPVTDRLDALRSEISDQRVRAADATDLMTKLPDMLGADGERVYLVMFTTPSEARGLGGFTGNWAEITADNGRIAMTNFGRSDELDAAAPAGARTITGPADWLQRYGSYGFNDEPGGTVGDAPFKNVTMSPLMSSTGSVIAQLYAQSGGRPVDGVFAADVYVLAELLRLTGPVDVAGADKSVDAKNAVEFLLHNQYLLPDKGERVELIEETSRAVVDQMFGGARLEPNKLLRRLGPLAEQGRLAGWAVRPDEQSLLERVGLAGTLLPRTRDDAVTVAFNNSAGNKIDYYLQTSGRYEATIDAAGTVDGVFEVTLENTAPTEREPRYVIANAIDQPLGTNQTYVSIYTALPTSDLTVDGVAVPAESGVEAGYHVTSAVVLIPSGQTRTVRVRISGPFDPVDGYTLLVRSPPIVGSMPIQIDLTVKDDNGSRVVNRELDTAGVERIHLELDASGDN